MTEGNGNNDRVRPKKEHFAYGLLGTIERKPLFRLYLGYIFALGGNRTDAREALKAYTSVDIDERAIGSRFAYMGNQEMYTKRLLSDRYFARQATHDENHTAYSNALRVMLALRPSGVWLYDDTGAALAHILLSEIKVSERIFSTVICAHYGISDEKIAEQIRARLKRAFHEDINLDATLASRGRAQIDAMRIEAAQLLKSLPQLDNLHRRSHWAKDPDVRFMVASLLTGGATAGEMRDAIMTVDPSYEVTLPSLEKRIMRYRKKPAAVVKNLMQASTSIFSEQCMSQPFWARNVLAGKITIRMIEKGAAPEILIRVLDTLYPAHNIPPAVLQNVFRNESSARIICILLRALYSKNPSQGSAVDDEFIESRTNNLITQYSS